MRQEVTRVGSEQNFCCRFSWAVVMSLESLLSIRNWLIDSSPRGSGRIELLSKYLNTVVAKRVELAAPFA